MSPNVQRLKARLSLWRTLRRVPDARWLIQRRVFKHSEETLVMAGRLRGRDVVIKQMLGKDPEARAKAQADELAIQHVHMGAGFDRVPEPILPLPKHGIVIMEHAPGQRVDKALRDGGDRAEILRKSARWLGKYTELRRVGDTFGGGYWIKTRKSELNAMPPNQDHSRIAGLIDFMERERARIGTCALTRVRSHGDFSPLNLIVDGNTMWGVDIQNTHWIALAKDIARFLVHLEISVPNGATDGPLGFAKSDIEAFLMDDRLITLEECDRVLPFFIAVELSGRLRTEVRDTTTMKHARALADRVLDQAARL